MTQEELKELLTYDQETGVFYWNVPVGHLKAGSKAGSIALCGYVKIRIKNSLYKAHRLAWIYVHGSIGNYQIDHINMIKSDNRLSNLRICSSRLNAQNKKVAQKNNKSGFLGVCVRGDKFDARIQVGGKKFQLGTFRTKEEAHKAYVNAKRVLHPFGNL